VVEGYKMDSPPNTLCDSEMGLNASQSHRHSFVNKIKSLIGFEKSERFEFRDPNLTTFESSRSSTH